MLADYKNNWATYKEYEQGTIEVFRLNLEYRWGKALNGLRILADFSREDGQRYNNSLRRSKSQRNRRLRAVLSGLHLRGRALGRVVVAPASRDRIGKWRLDIARRRLKAEDGRVRQLTATECCLLEIFLEQPDIALRSIDAYIHRLREKLGGHPQALIGTISGKGYRLVPDGES